MNKKTNYLKELNEIKNLSSKIRNINESIMFEDDFENFSGDKNELPQDDMGQEPSQEQMPQEEPIQQGNEEQQTMDKKSPEEQGMNELDKMGEVDQIRRITLDGMRKLCDTPEAPEFQALLKIFQICNKAVDKDEIEQK